MQFMLSFSLGDQTAFMLIFGCGFWILMVNWCFVDVIRWSA
jgi:hypothetical protein